MIKKILFIILSISITCGGLFTGLNFSKAADTTGNLILNPSVETIDSTGTAPLSWQNYAWGTNSPVFTYKTDAITGAKSVYVKMNSFTSGDAKWYFDPVTILPNTQYLFNDYYKSSVTTEVIAQITDSNGVRSHQYLGSVPSSSAWKKQGFVFTTPQNAAKITILGLIRKGQNQKSY